MSQHQVIEMAGIIFNDKRRSNTPPEQTKSCKDVTKLAAKHGWSVFENPAYHSDSYPTGSRDGKPIFMTSYARNYVVSEFHDVAEEFLKAVKIK